MSKNKVKIILVGYDGTRYTRMVEEPQPHCAPGVVLMGDRMFRHEGRERRGTKNFILRETGNDGRPAARVTPAKPSALEMMFAGTFANRAGGA